MLILWIQSPASAATAWVKSTLDDTSMVTVPPSAAMSKRPLDTSIASRCFCTTTTVRFRSPEVNTTEAERSSYSPFACTEKVSVARPRLPSVCESVHQYALPLTNSAVQLPEADRSIEAVPASELKSTVMVSPPPESVAWEERNESTT